MCPDATRAGANPRAVRAIPWQVRLLAIPALVCAATAQMAAPDWRHIGNSAIELSMAAPASGPVDRVWYSPDGSQLFARTASGRTFVTADFEKWQPAGADPPDRAPGEAVRAPESGYALRAGGTSAFRMYSIGRQVYRSDDGGTSWTSLTAYQQQSIIGGGMRDMAVSPLDSDEIVIANDSGIWRSADGGQSWSGLNESLPNLPVKRLAGLPAGSRGVRLMTSAIRDVVEWAPGEKLAWRTVTDPAGALEVSAKRMLSTQLGAEVTALAASGDLTYAGAADGRLFVSMNRGQTWITWPGERGPAETLWVDAQDPRVALAAFGGVRGARVLRTVNGGQFWDDVSSDLPVGAAHGVAADRATGSVYLATDAGLFWTHMDLNAAGPATNWTALPGLRPGPVKDVKLDAGGNQLYTAVEGYGVFATLAPHRVGNPKLVNAADFSARAAAPGSLLSVLGERVRGARAGVLSFPVLAATDAETQIQVPFSASGPVVSLSLDTGRGSVRVSVPVESVSPAVFVDRDGTPLVLDADTGVLLDVMNPARSNSRLQILATGLGKVQPDWPAGQAGPLDNPPQVVATVHAYLDRMPIEVTRATLAPGYIGLYLVEVQLPSLLNAGPAELYIVAGNQDSNRVRVWLEP